MKMFSKAHNYLCSKFPRYHSWHHHPHHQKIHIGILSIYSSAVLTLTLFILFTPINNALATSAATWDMGTASDYNYDDTKLEFSEGVAQLKATGVPGTDWIAADGGGNNWAYQKPITISNTDGTVQTDYQILLTLDTTGDKIQDDCDDLRFTTADKITAVNYWIESGCNTSSTKIWVKVPSIATPPETTTIYMYYGNTAATIGSNGDNTFIFFDDFNAGTISSSKWNVYNTGVSYTQSNGKLHLYAANHGAWDVGIASKQTFARSNIIAEVEQKRIGVYSPYNAIMFGWKDTTASISYTTLAYGMYLQGDGSCTTSCTNPYYQKGGGVGSYTWNGTLPYTLRMRLKSAGGNSYERSTDGGNTWTTDVSNTTYTDTPLTVAMTQHSGDYDYDNLKVRKWATVEPTSSIDTESILLPTTHPTLTLNTGQGYSSLSGFSQTLGAGSTGTVKYQISPDNGSTWYWWNGSTWASTAAGYTEANLSTDINTHIATFTAGAQPKVFKWRSYFNSDGSQQPKLDNVSLNYIWDTGAPNNVAEFSAAKSQLSGGVDLAVSDGSRWYNYPNPHFEWNNPGDTANEGETASGIDSYKICFNTNDTCHPINEGTSQTGTEYTASDLVSGNTYYFRIRTKDNAGNYSVDENQIFTYKYDGDRPTTPQYVSAAPSGYSNNKDFSFIWPTANSAAATDTGGSLLRGYQYRINDDPTWYGINHTGDENDIIPVGTGTIDLNNADKELINEGTNTFYLRTIDNAGNTSASTIQVPFYFSTSSPPPPSVINVTPVTNTTNDFSFSWPAVEDWPGGIAKYYYSFNRPPTSSSAYTTLNHIDNQAAATSQGENIIYVVAEDSAGNITWGNYKTASFYANTPAPGLPTNLQVSDQSIRAVAYKTSLSWATPEEVGIGVHHYNVYRKDGSGDYALIASPTGRYYLDESVQPTIEYSYKVRAVDSADKESADSTVILITPKGRYDSPARVVSGSIKTEVTSRTSSISWQTETNRDPYTNEIHTTDSMVAYGKTQALESTAADREFSFNHNINLRNLEPDTIYYYKVLGVDENGNRTESSISTFQTEKPTVISKVEMADLRQTTAILKWESSRITTTEVLYGKSTAYGLTYKEGDIPNATTHTVFLKDLEAGTQYHFQIQGKDQYGDVIKSDDYTLLKTLEFPKITNVTFQPLAKEATTTIEVNWTTNIPTDGRVSYATTDGTIWREEYDGTFKTDHKFKIGEGKLLDKKTYLFKALVRDQYGNEVTSETQTYTTPEDTRPPVMSNLQTEVSVEGSGDTAQVSAVITWDTDEPADSQVFYGEGTSGDTSNSSNKDSTLVTSHLVVVSNLKPAQTYHLKAKSADKSGNLSESNSQNFVTNQAAQSVINIILTRLQQVFGWMSK